MALKDFTKIIKKDEYRPKLKRALKLISSEKDAKILAAALVIKANHFVTGDEDFFIPEIRKLITVQRTKEVLKDIKNK